MYRDGRWRKVGQGISRFFGMGGSFLGNPTADAAADVHAVNDFLTQEQLPAEVDAVVAFLNPKVNLDVLEPELPVTNGEGLKPYIACRLPHSPPPPLPSTLPLLTPPPPLPPPPPPSPADAGFSPRSGNGSSRC